MFWSNGCLHLQVNRARMNRLEVILDVSLAVLFALLTVACAAASLRYIIVDSQNYSVCSWKSLLSIAMQILPSQKRDPSCKCPVAQKL